MHINYIQGALTAYLKGGEDAARNNDQQPEIHVEKLTDHIGHVSWKDQQEQAQTNSTKMLPEAPEKQQGNILL